MNFITSGIVFALFFTLPIFGSEKAKQSQNSMNYKVLIESLIKDKIFSVRGEAYVLLPELQSYKTQTTISKPNVIESSNNNTNSASAQTSGQTNFVARKGNYIIIKSNNKDATLNKSWNKTGNTELFPVVLNQRTQQFGIVTREVSVELLNASNANIVSEEYNIKIVRSFDHLRLTIYQTTIYQDIFDLVNKLGLDPRVKKANIEIIENVIEPL